MLISAPFSLSFTHKPHKIYALHELKCQVGALWNKSQKCELNDIKVQLW